MYETEEFTDKQIEREIRKSAFSITFLDTLITMGCNLAFYIIALVTAFTTAKPNLMIATWPIAAFLLIEVASITVAAFLKIYKDPSDKNAFICNILKSVARCAGFIVGIGFVIYGSISSVDLGPANTIAVLTSTYGVLSILIGLPLFIWSITHLSVTASALTEEMFKNKKRTKTKRKDDVVVDSTTSSAKYQSNPNSTADAIEVEVRDINDA